MCTEVRTQAGRAQHVTPLSRLGISVAGLPKGALSQSVAEDGEAE